MPELSQDGPEQEAGDPPTVPTHEIAIDFVRSSGPGGQNVNKRSTQAQLRWNVGASQAFTDEQKAAIRAYAGNLLKDGDDIRIDEQGQRSQLQNRETAVRKLQDLVAEALTPKKDRIPTKVKYSQKQQRLEEKRREGRKKQERKFPKGEW